MVGASGCAEEPDIRDELRFFWTVSAWESEFVVGGLLGINDTWFRTRSTYEGSILQAPTGIYRPSGAITDTLSGGGLILVFRMDDNNACVFQVTGNGVLAVRTMNVNNGKWSEWNIIANPSFPT